MNKITFLISIIMGLMAFCTAQPFAQAQTQALNELRQITPNFPSFTFVDDAEVTADGQYLVFSGDARLRFVDELFSIPITGDEGDMVRLNMDLVSGGNVSSFTLSGDGQTVFYIADAEIDGRSELFSVPVTGGESRRLNPSFMGDTSDRRQVQTPILLEPSGEHVIYRLDLAVQNEFELVRTPVSGGDSVRLSQPGVGSRLVLSNAGDTLVFSSDQRADGILELFSVPVEGSADDVRRLHPELTAEQDIFDAQISPDGRQVIFQVSTGPRFIDLREELFSAPIDGSSNTSFQPLVENYPSDTGDIRVFTITPDGNFVVYRSDQRIDGTLELFRVALNGGPAVRLSADMQINGRVDAFVISPTGDRVVYIADGIINDANALFSVPLTGSASDAVPVDPNINSVDDVMDAVISGDGRNVIFERQADVDLTIQLFIAPVEGGQDPKPFSPIFGDPDENEEGELNLSAQGTQLSYVPPDGRRVFAARVALPRVDNNDDELCLPISSQGGKIAVICL